MATDADITIRLATIEDKQPILLFFRKFFFRDEPISKALEIVTDKNPINKDWEQYAFLYYDHGCSLVAEYKGKIIAVLLNGIAERGIPHKKFVPTPGDKFEVISDLLDTVINAVDYFKIYNNVNKILMILKLSVDENFRKKGIGKMLLQKAIELGKELNVELVTIECSSYYSAAAVKRLGFKEMYSLNYADFKKNGQVRVTPAPPHTAMTLLALLI